MADKAAVDDLLPDSKKKPAVDPGAKVGGAELAKVGAGLVVCLVSIAFFIHRIPHHEYVAVHQDKPRRPRPAADTDNPDSPVAASAPRLAAKPVAPAPSAAKPASAASAAKGVTAVSAPERSSAPVVDLEDACAAEAPLLCYHVSAARLPRCLSQYDDALRKSCRDALGDKLAEIDRKR